MGREIKRERGREGREQGHAIKIFKSVFILVQITCTYSMQKNLTLLEDYV